MSDHLPAGLTAPVARGRKPSDTFAVAAGERELVVLKFGSSVLHHEADLDEVVTEIYRTVREGRRVLAVVSAFEGVTDQLLSRGQSLGCAHDNAHLPRFVVLGEETAAASLALACDRAGLAAIPLCVAELGLTAEGERESATPVRLDPQRIEAGFSRHDVVVAPGYGALDANGEIVLLGRGGSDMTAVFLAAALGAERVRLVKDVDGVYDRDPKGEGEALRFGQLSWEHALEVAGVLVQSNALAFAQRHRLNVEVGALGRQDVTVIGASGAPPRPRRRLGRLRVALAGCGVVGGGVLERLQRHPDAFEITGVLIRDGAKARPEAPDHVRFTTSADDLFAGAPDVVVDLLSSAETGGLVCARALAGGIHVVSANKQAVVARHAELLRLSRETGAQLLYSAAVGGGAALIETARQARQSGEVIALQGVLNGTVNFMLELLWRGASFDEALAAAREAGLAESDPSADLEGFDAAAKARILAQEAFGEMLPLDRVERQTLDAEMAVRAGRQRLKQVTQAVRTARGVMASVEFRADSPFNDVVADRNALRVIGADGRAWVARGRGAGRWPTTESVFSDLVDLRAHAGLGVASGDTSRAAGHKLVRAPHLAGERLIA